MKTASQDSLEQNYQHEEGLSTMFDCLRDPKAVEHDRLEAKRNKFGTMMFRHIINLGGRMLQSVEMGEYVGARNRETARDMVTDQLATKKHTDVVKMRRSAESKRRTAQMMEDVDEMYQRAARHEAEAEL